MMTRLNGMLAEPATRKPPMTYTIHTYSGGKLVAALKKSFSTLEGAKLKAEALALKKRGTPYLVCDKDNQPVADFLKGNQSTATFYTQGQAEEAKAAAVEVKAKPARARAKPKTKAKTRKRKK